MPPAPVEEAKEKPRILIIDKNRDFTLSAKLGLERRVHPRTCALNLDQSYALHEISQAFLHGRAPACGRPVLHRLNVVGRL